MNAEAELLRLTNQARHQAGLPDLRRGRGLTRAARAHARWMAAHRVLSHDEGPAPWWRHIYRVVGKATFASIGENVADGYDSAGAVFEAWMNSPEHRANILSPKFRFQGLGAVGTYWCVDFSGSRLR